MSSSGILGNRIRFPSYFQLLATMEKTAIGYFGVIRKFGWRRIALIVQDENLWTAVCIIIANMGLATCMQSEFYSDKRRRDRML